MSSCDQTLTPSPVLHTHQSMEAPCKKATKGGDQCAASSSSSSVVTNLPSHILAEILFSLPLKTIVTCKCVCKSWLHLLCDPQFSKQHQATAKIEVCLQRYYHPDVNPVKLYMHNFCSRNDSDCVDMKIKTLLELPKFSVKSNNVPNYEVTRGRFTFVNSCNGLLCYSCEPNKFAVIWNPITSEFVTLPAPKINKGLSNCRAYGLGFSQKDYRFKLLRIMARKEKKCSEEDVVAEICTVEKGCSWRTVGPCPYSNPFDERFYGRPYGMFLYWRPLGSFLQSALHWLDRGSSQTDKVIVSFDFEDEKFGEVPLPPHFKTTTSRYPYVTLGVLAGCLFVTDQTDLGVSVWLMKEYGDQDSWTNVFSLQFTRLERSKYKYCFPINYLDNGEILMMRNDGFYSADLFLYNQVLKSVTVICSRDSLSVVAFSPSLVLLKDSMMGYDVHVISRGADLEHKEIASPSWWKPPDHVVTRRPEQREQQQTQMPERLPDAVIREQIAHIQAQIDELKAELDQLLQDKQLQPGPSSTTPTG